VQVSNLRLEGVRVDPATFPALPAFAAASSQALANLTIVTDCAALGILSASVLSPTYARGPGHVFIPSMAVVSSRGSTAASSINLTCAFPDIKLTSSGPRVTVTDGLGLQNAIAVSQFPAQLGGPQAPLAIDAAGNITWGVPGYYLQHLTATQNFSINGAPGGLTVLDLQG
jgi:hypothetical protein